MPSKKRLRRVAVAYPLTVPWMALFMRGVLEYADQHGGWIFTTSPPTLTGTGDFALDVYGLKGWPGDGVIAAIDNAAEARAAKKLGIPVVNLAGAVRQCSVPRVMVDHYAIGQLGAEHLLECGLRRLAFWGMEGSWYAKQRCLGFVQKAERAGVWCDVLETPIATSSRVSWQQQIAPLQKWLKTLKPPVGVMAVHDYRARILIDECQRQGLCVPHDAAIIGVDNDPTVCEFCKPTISSISRNAWRVGYETALLLDRLMSGKTPPDHDVLIPPDGVALRQSTDTVAIDDPALAAAVHFMRDHFGESFGIGRVLQHTTISRRHLELRFRRFLHCTPHDYLLRIRVERARTLLESPERQKLRNIAASCGFGSVERLRAAFRRFIGLTPADYRRKYFSEHPC